ncbi:MAG: hypothetical protein CVU73_11000 [Deltaproteobacteria bacterium HGW-Deltaproteobacteria-8]|jgi:hypothetical protein|nr:MAG: hypothetical protein CVU73_11000 [Deltaproteobacteria bacterium HGW-Deltaproteobacteria-8]
MNFDLPTLAGRLSGSGIIDKRVVDMTKEEALALCEAVLDAASQRTLFIKAVGSDLAGKVGLVDDVPF